MSSTDRDDVVSGDGPAEEEPQRIVGAPPPPETTPFDEKATEKEDNNNNNDNDDESAKSSSSSYSTASFTSIAGDIQRTVMESKDSAIRSVSSLQHSSSSHLRSFQGFVPQLKSEFRAYEDTFFSHLKDEVIAAKQHPAAALGLGLAASFLLLRGPRRFLFRHTLGRFQSEEAQFVRAENNVKELNLSVGLMKKESRKLLERTALAEKEMKQGHDELMNAGGSIQRLAKSMYKVESQAAELMDGLREIPGREPLRLRAEVASMASALNRHRVLLDKRIMKISELGVSV